MIVFFKKGILVFVFVQFSLICFSQIVFTKGYIVNNKGLKIACLIKNKDWLYNPSKIEYKLNENSETINVDRDSIQEFGIENFSRYVRTTIKIDRSPIQISLLDKKPQPTWSEETLFLKELVTGKAALWEYVEPDKCWYFYSFDNSIPEQLVFKEYRIENNYNGSNSVAENTAFRQQLFANIQNENTRKIAVEKIRYTKKELMDYFQCYNSSAAYSTSNIIHKPKRDIFDLKMFGSVYYTSLSVFNSSLDSKAIEFGPKLNWMVGLEFEYFLPFNRNTWSLILSPTYDRTYDSKSTDTKFLNIVVQKNTRMFDVQSITFPIGLRYTTYMNNRSKLYFDLSYNSSYVLSFKKYFNYNGFDYLKADEAANLIIGAGYSVDSWGLGLKYHSNRQLLNTYGVWDTNNSKVSLSFTYKLFKIIGI